MDQKKKSNISEVYQTNFGFCPFLYSICGFKPGFAGYGGAGESQAGKACDFLSGEAGEG